MTGISKSAESLSIPDSFDELSQRMRTDFTAIATLRKWPSFRNQRVRSTRWSEPYFVIEAPLDACICEFLAKPANQRHLYEIHTGQQTQPTAAVLSADQIIEIARLRDFL